MNRKHTTDITHHTPHTTGLRLNPLRAERARSASITEPEVEESHKAKMVWAATPNNGCSTGEPQAVQFLFFLGGFFFSFIKKRKKPQSQHIADNVRCTALRTQPGQEVTTVTALQNLTPG